MKVIHHVFDMDAPRAKAWWALTEVDGMAGWWTTKVETANAAVGTHTHWTFGGDFNPVMEITTLNPEEELGWRCVGGHGPWKDNTFRFQLSILDDGRTMVRFWQDYAVELDDDAYGTYNYNWGYYLESLRLLCVTGTGKPFQPGRQP
jgi:uncharacterized protein YndB with AHSA1/START domain